MPSVILLKTEVHGNNIYASSHPQPHKNNSRTQGHPVKIPDRQREGFLYRVHLWDFLPQEAVMAFDLDDFLKKDCTDSWRIKLCSASAAYWESEEGMMLLHSVPSCRFPSGVWLATVRTEFWTRKAIGQIQQGSSLNAVPWSHFTHSFVSYQAMRNQTIVCMSTRALDEKHSIETRAVPLMLSELTVL